MENILDVKDLEVSFNTSEGEIKAVRGVNFHVVKGETIAIVGESGSGKSVTAQSILKLIQSPPGEIKNGQIIFNGENLLTKSDHQMQEIRGKEIGMIFQNPISSLNPVFTVGSQIMESLQKHLKMSKQEARIRAIELLDLVGITMPEKRIKQYPHQFSGGMCQRVMIAMTLATNPKLLIADEPTTALDVSIQEQILDLLKDLQKKLNISIIFITHDLGVVARIADRVAVMYAGKIIEFGEASDIFYDSKHPYTKGLLSSMPNLDSSKNKELPVIPGLPPNLLNPPKGDAFALRNPDALQIDFEKEPPMFKVSDTHYAATWLLNPDESYMKRKKSNKERTEKATISYTESKERGNTPQNKKKILEINNLKKHFNENNQNEVRAVDDITFNIYQGETLGLVGESGSGKSTTGRTIVRLEQLTSGEILFHNESIFTNKSRNERKELARKIQMVFQDPFSSLNPRMTVAKIISEGIRVHGLVKNKRDLMKRVHELLKDVELDPSLAHRYPHQLSGGQQQRVGIARALGLNPEVIIADEPISALDVSIQAQIVNLLKRLQKEKGLTFLFIAHDLSMAKYISDRIAVMRAGKIVELADSEELYRNPLHPYTKSLLSIIPRPDPKSEREKEKILYYASSEKNNGANMSFKEITPGHFVMCTENEYNMLTS